jgi:hypothetical protein
LILNLGLFAFLHRSFSERSCFCSSSCSRDSQAACLRRELAYHQCILHEKSGTLFSALLQNLTCIFDCLGGFLLVPSRLLLLAILPGLSIYRQAAKKKEGLDCDRKRSFSTGACSYQRECALLASVA